MWTLVGTHKAADGSPPVTIILPAVDALPEVLAAGVHKYTVGRKDADICIPSDKSLSRTHAELALSGEGFTSLTVRDLGSKFGVTIGDTRLGDQPAALVDGTTMKLGSMIFRISRRPLILCTSGVNPTDRAKLKAAAAKLGATLSREWREDVTHLVMPNISWTSKLLTALAACVPVVSPEWVVAAAERATPTASMPPTAEFAPRPAPTCINTIDLETGVEVVRPERARLFAGKRILCLPASAGAAADAGAGSAALSDGDEQVRKLLERMGATLVPWPSPPPAGTLDQHIARWIGEGLCFLSTDSDDTVRVSPEAQAVLSAGGTLYTPLLVRTSLVRANLQATAATNPASPAAAAATAAAKSQAQQQRQQPSARGAKAQASSSPPVPTPAAAQQLKSAKAAKAPGRSEVAAALDAASEAVPSAAAPTASQGAEMADASQAAAEAPTQTASQAAKAAAHKAAHAPASAPAPAAAENSGWNQKRKKDPANANFASAPTAIVQPSSSAPSHREAASVCAEASSQPDEGACAPPPAAEPLAAEPPAAEPPRPPVQPPVAVGEPPPPGWNKRPRCMLRPDADGGALNIAPPPPTHHVPLATAPVSSKRFKKVGGRGPGALVRVRMETVVTGRDGDEQAHAGEDVPEDDADQLFEEAVQQGRAAGGRRRAR